jgi:cysteine-rich repeat protein
MACANAAVDQRNLPRVTSACTSGAAELNTVVCGNGVVATGEACDDGNVVSGDGCDSNCTVTACGNGIVTVGEACDDGNQVNGDGCDNDCTASACGNGVRAPNEGCDDGNQVNGDGCSDSCTAEQTLIRIERFTGERGECEVGGLAILTGFDIDGDAMLDANEVKRHVLRGRGSRPAGRAR